MPYNVLSLDGGGIRGIITVVLLQRLSEMPGLGGWLGDVNLVAGTSTGGLIALGLAAGKPLDEIRGLYVDEGKNIFDDSWLDDLKDMGKLTGADYDIDNLKEVLKRVIGQTSLAALGKRVLVTAFDLDNEDPDPAKRTWKPKIFHNFPGDDSDGDALAYKVGLYTAAAPTYFPTVDGYIDGGVYAPNPSMCALAQTQDARTGEAAPLAEVRLLSIGTGASLIYIEDDEKEHDWGYVQWAQPLTSLLFEGINGIAHFQCSQILGPRYHRLAPVFPPNVSIPMDGVDRMDYMIEFAMGVDLGPASDWIANHWNR
ncbi:MAG: patatin-like phospholipase family protein [Acidobacteriota bacterium]